MESQRNRSFFILGGIFFFLFFIFITGCNNNPAPVEKPVNPGTSTKSKKSSAKPAANPWAISSFAPKDGDSTSRKYVRYVTDGTFSSKTTANGYLYAELLVTKVSAGIFLHESKKSNPMAKFNGPVQITMKNSGDTELRMTSGRGWNKSGGILIEKNNNDYSQFRIFMLQSNGIINVEINDADSASYNFKINPDGFSTSFGGI